MSQVREMNPAPEDFAGNAPAQVFKRLFNATRPKFYPASVLPVIAGSAWGFAVTGGFQWGVFIVALLATVLVHAGSNVLNDVGDELSDGANDDRIYPYTGGSRFIQAGILNAVAMARLGAGLLVAAALLGLLLLIEKGPMILVFGLAGVALAVLYSIGPVRLSSIGLGELSIGIAFGVIPVTGAAWLQSGLVDTAAVVFSVPIALWVTAILLINEVPDIAADRLAGKGTLPVRFGPGVTAVLYFLLHLGAAAATTWLAVRGYLPILAPAVPVLLLFLAGRSAMAIRHGIDNREAMTGAIEATLGIHTIGSIWMTGCALYLALTAAG